MDDSEILSFIRGYVDLEIITMEELRRLYKTLGDFDTTLDSLYHDRKIYITDKTGDNIINMAIHEFCHFMLSSNEDRNKINYGLGVPGSSMTMTTHYGQEVEEEVCVLSMSYGLWFGFDEDRLSTMATFLAIDYTMTIKYSCRLTVLGFLNDEGKPTNKKRKEYPLLK